MGKLASGPVPHPLCLPTPTVHKAIKRAASPLQLLLVPLTLLQTPTLSLPASHLRPFPPAPTRTPHSTPHPAPTVTMPPSPRHAMAAPATRSTALGKSPKCMPVLAKVKTGLHTCVQEHQHQHRQTSTQRQQEEEACVC